MNLYLIDGHITITPYMGRTYPIIDEMTQRIIWADTYEEACAKYEKHWEDRGGGDGDNYVVSDVSGSEAIR